MFCSKCKLYTDIVFQTICYFCVNKKYCNNIDEKNKCIIKKT